MKSSVCFLLFLACVVQSHNILGLFSLGAKSHFILFSSLMKELAKRGHNVVVVSPFKENKAVQNYTEVNIPIETLVNVVQFDHIKTAPLSFFDMAHLFESDLHKNANSLLSIPVQNLILTNNSFDVVIVEVFTDQVFLLLANKFNAPIIGFAACLPFPWALSQFAAPQNPSYIPSIFSGYSKQMTFFNRIWNTILIISKNFFYKYILCPKSAELFQKHIGRSELLLENAAKNISLFLVNTHFSYHSARPYPPQVIEVGGLHIQPAKTVHQELDKWMNESLDGVIYFSFGSMLRCSTLPQDKVKIFLKVFKKFPQRILWKWEDDVPDTLPDNVKIMKWLAQRDILAHPKVKVFISHGGLLGTTEAVVSGVPVLGIPMYGDQPTNIAALVENGVAIYMDYNNITADSLFYALNELLHEKSYFENAKLLSQRFLDRPQSPLETAIYWTEYVIRHRGAPHLQSAAVNLAWYQYYLLDVIAFCFSIIIIMLLSSFYSIKFIISVLFYCGNY